MATWMEYRSRWNTPAFDELSRKHFKRIHGAQHEAGGPPQRVSASVVHRIDAGPGARYPARIKAQHRDLQPMKQADIREATIRAHDLEFAVIMELDVTEAAFKTFCVDLQETIGNWDFDKVMELRRGTEGAFSIDYEDGSCDMVGYDARGGRLLIKGMTKGATRG